MEYLNYLKSIESITGICYLNDHTSLPVLLYLLKFTSSSVVYYHFIENLLMLKTETTHSLDIVLGTEKTHFTNADNLYKLIVKSSTENIQIFKYLIQKFIINSDDESDKHFYTNCLLTTNIDNEVIIKYIYDNLSEYINEMSLDYLKRRNRYVLLSEFIKKKKLLFEESS